MHKRILFFFFLSSFLFFGRLKAQTSLADSAANYPVIMQYYTYADLQSMDSMRLSSIIYYYTASFTVTPLSCSDCIPFDPATFDISRYENMRQFNTVFTRDFDKYGFTLTLVPVNAMPYRYPIHDHFFIDNTVVAEPAQH